MLTFSGSGAMNNYKDTGYTAPWREFKDDIKKAVVEDGVTSVGEYAFARTSKGRYVRTPLR